MSDDHIVPRGAIEGVDLPKETIEALVTTGVPPVVRLPDWPGPTLFSSELGGGRLVSTTDEGALVRRTGDDAGYIIGAVRDTNDDAHTAYSAFALRRGSGEVHLLDATNPEDDRFVGSSLMSFLTALDAFHTAWPHLSSATPEADEVVASFRALLSKLDPRALEDEHHYWPGWLEELE